MFIGNNKQNHRSITNTCIFVRLIIVTAVVTILAGCAVPQRAGRGSQFTLTEPKTNKRYFLYLPVGYNPTRRWPVVLTLHGMKPFDSSDAQIREWQSTADEFGLIVIAPDLWNSDIFMQYPLRKITGSVQKDIDAVMDILDYVLDHTAADRSRVMATSWSSGGYLLHYIVNHYPDRFAALSARGSCFNPDILEIRNARRMASRNFPVMIFYGQNDFSGVRGESQNAIRWYKSLGFKVTSGMVPGLGHERRPRIAAEFFAKSAGLTGKIKIVSSAMVGIAPLLVNLSVQLPHPMEPDHLSYLWTLDGKSLGTAARVYTSIPNPGVHDVQVTITDRNGKKLTSREQITVLPSRS